MRCPVGPRRSGAAESPRLGCGRQAAVGGIKAQLTEPPFSAPPPPPPAAAPPPPAQIGQIRQDLAAVRETGSALWEPYFLALLADVYAQEGQVEEGLATLAEALAAAQATGERWGEAELYRLRASLLLRQTGTPQAEVETWLQRALDVARRQEAKSLELRAAMSLSRLWHQEGKRQEAHDLLAVVYAWFTEGFDTADLQEAKALLEELA
jgi:predicted ATPase